MCVPTLTERDREASITRRTWPTKGCYVIGGGGVGKYKKYNKYLPVCIATVHKIQTIILSRSNRVILDPYGRKHSIALPAVLSSSFAIRF